MLAGEQAAQLELVRSLASSDVDRVRDLGLLRLVVDFARQLVEDLGVVELLREAVVDGRGRRGRGRTPS